MQRLEIRNRFLQPSVLALLGVNLIENLVHDDAELAQLSES